ncbi:MAG: ANTAR domain-containing protein [Nocardioidaceae bacterium]
MTRLVGAQTSAGDGEGCQRCDAWPWTSLAWSHRQQVELNKQLQLEQPKGMLAAKRQMSPERAFEPIRQHARSRGATVPTVADAVVNLGLEI